MIQPNWQLNFRNLPTIPLLKRWVPGQMMTMEQIIMQKAVMGGRLNTVEMYSINSLAEFYKELGKSLAKIDYSTFTGNDFDNYKNYIFYAMNYLCLMSNQITVFSTYRLVVNEWVTGENKPLDDVSFLKYPTLDIVKKINKYNRANTPATNVFYSSETIDTCIKETRPPKNKLITVGVWQPKSNRKFTTFPISHSEQASKVHEGVAKATAALAKQHLDKALENYMKMYFSLLANEYTKKINHHYEYLYSSLFSERILATQDKKLSEFRFDCIEYPSVGNDFRTSNLAMLPSVFDDNFFLKEAIEFEIEQEFYDRKHSPMNHDLITLAKVKNVRRSKPADVTGPIIWLA
jgi:hypothetical protein